MLTDLQVEDALAASPSPDRITKDYIEERIAETKFLGPEVTGGQLTICIITTDTGFQVNGESACADPANYNKEIGEKYAYDRAFAKLWPLYGFQMKTLVAHKAELRKTGKNPDVVEIARICHEANRGICVAAGDNSQKSWEEADDWQRQSAISGVNWRIANTDASYSAQHDAWAKERTGDGWVYGLVKDPTKKTHPCLVPYEELPFEQKVKDYVFVQIVKSMIS